MASQVTGPKLEAMLRRVQGLLRQADHPTTEPAEAQTFRNKAEALMLQYRIDEAMLVQKTAGLNPTWAEFVVCAMRSEYSYYYQALAVACMEHVGVRGVVRWRTNKETKLQEYRCIYVGFESDLRIVDMLYTSCMLAFQTRLEPRVDRNLSDQVNAYNMRKAGMEGWRIASALWGDRKESNLYRARRLFKQEALARGEDPSELLGQGNSMRIYRESYAMGFMSELNGRLRRMRMSRGGLGEMVLAGRKEAIDAAFYERYPEYAPPKPLPAGPGAEEDDEEAQEGSGGRRAKGYARTAYKDPREGCERCQKAKSGYCREHSYLRPSTAAYRDKPVNYAGLRRGREAARSVDLGPSSSQKGLGS